MRQQASRLSGRKVLLTGATGGIGRAIARQLTTQGVELVLTARRQERLTELARELGAMAVASDLAEPGSAAALAEQASELLGGSPDILINNAGAFELASFTETTPSAFDRLVSVNLRAPFLLTRILLPDMLERASGHVVNVGSVAGRKAFPGNAAYAATKFGLRGLHEVLIEELRGTGVRATWVEPSAVNTALWDRFEPDAREELPSRDEMLSVEAVADAVSFALDQVEAVAVQEVVVRSNPSGRIGD